MRSLLLSAVLGVASLGVLAAAPAKAEASWLSQALHTMFDPAYYDGPYCYAPGYPYGYYAPGYGYFMPGYEYVPSTTYYYAPAPHYVPYPTWAYGPRDRQHHRPAGHD